MLRLGEGSATRKGETPMEEPSRSRSPAGLVFGATRCCEAPQGLTEKIGRDEMEGKVKLRGALGYEQSKIGVEDMTGGAGKTRLALLLRL